MDSVIERIKQNFLCCGCGTCVALCPRKALTIEWNNYGEYQPIVTDTAACSSCGFCLKVCPFASGNPNETDIGNNLYESVPKILHTKETGYYLSWAAGAVTDERQRFASASGGLASWFLEQLLQEKIVDAVLCVRKSTDGHCLYQFSVAKTPGEVRESRGSVYYPTEMSSVIAYVLHNPGKYAAIGLPCFVKALRLASQKNKTLRERVVVIAGLTCGQMKSSHFTDYIAYLSSNRLGDVSSVYFRSKSPTRPASSFTYTYTYTYTDGQVSDIRFDQGISDVWMNRAFTLPACNYCDDVFAEGADITFMDAWLPEYSNESRGTSLWVCRSELAQALISRGVKRGEVSCREVAVEHVISVWAGLIREKRDLVSYRQAFCSTTVEKRVSPNIHAASLIDRYLCRKRLRILQFSRDSSLSSVDDCRAVKMVLDKEFHKGLFLRGAIFSMAIFRYLQRRLR